LLGVLEAHIRAAQQFRGFVAAHGSHHEFELSLHVRFSFVEPKAASELKSAERLPAFHHNAAERANAAAGRRGLGRIFHSFWKMGRDLRTIGCTRNYF